MYVWYNYPIHKTYSLFLRRYFLAGILKIKNRKNHSVENLSYYTMQQLDERSRKEKMQDIYEQYHHKQLELYCLCQSAAPINMSISYISDSDTYYLKSFPKQASKHHTDCHFHNENSLSSSETIYKKNCEEDEEGNYHITLDTHDYKIIKRAKKTKDSSALSPFTGGDTGQSTNKLSIQNLIKLIVTKAWNDYIFFNGQKEYPSLNHVFRQIYSKTTRHYFVTKELHLQSLLYKGGKPGQVYMIEQKLNRIAQPFALFMLDNYEKVDECSYLINVINPLNLANAKLVVSKELLEFAQSCINVSCGPYIVGGFIKSTGFGKLPEFISLGILPINNCGVPVESSYERELYDLLCKEKRIVQRPIDTQYHPKLNGLIPDGILLDTEKPTILEVFGISERNTEYHIHRRYKIELFSGLFPDYHFWYWDAYNQSEKPRLPTIGF